MITHVNQTVPVRSISQLCDLLHVSRSWYYETQTRVQEDETDVELRDRIERMILALREEAAAQGKVLPSHHTAHGWE